MTSSSQSKEMFHLKWDSRDSCPSFSDIWALTDLMDVWLACGQEEVRAHSVVLAACSARLRTVLARHSTHQHPVIYLWGMNISQVKALLAFMYHGEVNIAQEELQVNQKKLYNAAYIVLFMIFNIFSLYFTDQKPILIH